MKRRVSVGELARHASRVIASVESGGPVAITRHGKPAAVLMTHAQYVLVRTAAAEIEDLRFGVQALAEATKAGVQP